MRLRLYSLALVRLVGKGTSTGKRSRKELSSGLKGRREASEATREGKETSTYYRTKDSSLRTGGTKEAKIGPSKGSYSAKAN